MPLCPVHQKEMKAWPDGGYSCSVRVGEGMPGANAKGYCNQAIRAPRGNGGGAPPTPYRPAALPEWPVPIHPVPAIERDADIDLRIKALDFAVRYGATDAETALEVASRALAFLKGGAR